MPKPTPILDRIANHTGQDPDYIQWTLDNPLPGEGPCWLWTGARVGVTPVIKFEGKTTSVRRVLYTVKHGRMSPGWRCSDSPCLHQTCVNPNHGKLTSVNNAWPEPTPDELVPAEADLSMADTLEDAIYMVLTQDPPWDAPALATRFEYPLSLVEQAITEIVEKNL